VLGHLHSRTVSMPLPFGAEPYGYPTIRTSLPMEAADTALGPRQAGVRKVRLPKDGQHAFLKTTELVVLGALSGEYPGTLAEMLCMNYAVHATLLHRYMC